jgi:hypothetical protein
MNHDIKINNDTKKRCPKGFRRDKSGNCVPKDSIESNQKSNQSPKSNTKKNISPSINKTRKTVGMKHTDKDTLFFVMPNMKNVKKYNKNVASIVKSFDNKYNEEYNNATCTRTSSGIKLKSQQMFVTKYINLHTPYRGIVLWHGLGSGKTLSAISITEQFISDMNKENPDSYKYSVLFMSPAMLVSNFETEIQKFDEFYKYNEVYGENYDNFTTNGKLTSYDKIKNKNLFNNKVIIIDESQLVISTITRALLDNNITDKKIIDAYNDMIRNNSVKIVCLSGTPIDRKPAELAMILTFINQLY